MLLAMGFEGVTLLVLSAVSADIVASLPGFDNEIWPRHRVNLWTYRFSKRHNDDRGIKIEFQRHR